MEITRDIGTSSPSISTVYWEWSRHSPDRGKAIMKQCDSSTSRYLTEEKDKMAEEGDDTGEKTAIQEALARSLELRRGSHPTAKHKEPDREKVKEESRPTTAPAPHKDPNRFATSRYRAQTSMERPVSGDPTGRESRSLSSRGAVRKPMRAERPTQGPARVMSGAVRVQVHKVDHEPDKQEKIAKPQHENPERSLPKHQPISTLMSIIEGQTPSSPWTKRLQSMNSLKELIAGTQADLPQSEGDRKDIINHFDKLCALLVERVSDVHHKVASAVLDSLSELITGFWDTFETRMERALPAIFAQLPAASDNRSAVVSMLQKAATNCLNTIRRVYSSTTVANSIISSRVLDLPGHRGSQLGALETLNQLIKENGAQIASGNSMQQIVDKLLPLVRGRNAELRISSVQVLQTLFHENKEEFASIIKNLPYQARQDVRRLLGSKAQGLDQLLSEGKTGEKKSPRVEKNSKIPKVPSPQPSPKADKENEDKDAVWEKLNEEVNDSPMPGPPAPGYNPKHYEGRDSLEASHVNAAPKEEWESLLPNLLSTIDDDQDAVQRGAALHALAKMSADSGAKDVWDSHFGQILLSVLRAFHDEDNSVRLMAVRCAKSMLVQQMELLVGSDNAEEGSEQAKFLRVVADSLLQARGGEESPEVQHAADEALIYFADSYSWELVFEVLGPIISSDVGSVVAPAVRMFSRVVQRLDSETLVRVLDEILTPIFEAFKSEVADVRKAVVFCLVDLYMKLGDKLTPYLATLSTTQLKLVTIYINRQRQARKDTP